MKAEDLANEEINTKNKQLYDKVRNVLGYRVTCPECGEQKYVKQVWKDTFIPLIYRYMDEGKHPVDTLDSKDIEFIRCTECGTAVNYNMNSAEWSAVKTCGDEGLNGSGPNPSIV